jgi:GT2 family glycosyltransferase
MRKSKAKDYRGSTRKSWDEAPQAQDPRTLRRPFVSVIVPVFNDEKNLRVCLEALERQTYPQDAYEVVVVDNGSLNSMEPIVSRFEQTQYVFEPHGGSYSARNRGVSMAKGEVLGFTDSDCIPEPTWIEAGVSKLCESGDGGAVAGDVRFLFEIQNKPGAIELLDSISFFQQEYYVKYHHFGVTANLFAWKRVYDEVGAFDQGLRSGGDREWGRRVRSSGYRVLYADDVRVWHPARRSFGQMLKKVLRVAQGAYRLEKGDLASQQAAMRRVCKELLPPRARLKALQSDERIAGGVQKAKVAFLMVLFHYVRVLEKGRRHGRDLFSQGCMACRK